jgi:hypothetical protein
MSRPRITFGIIVLNGEPFTRYNLRALYPFAHEIIVVEGASPHASQIATPDGHSLDNTLQILREFKQYEDPDDKLSIVTAETEGYPNGFWPGEKDEQSRAYARRATGDWLWQVDIDEFYRPDQMQYVIDTLLVDPAIWTVSFKTITFWGGLTYHVDGWFLRHREGEEFHRVFRWKPGFTYGTHRPPTVYNQSGENLRTLGWKRGYDLAREQGIHLYHYSFVFPFQVGNKSLYYGSYFGRDPQWADKSYMRLDNPYRVHAVHRYPSWLDRYRGDHPPQALELWQQVEAGAHPGITVRSNSDVDGLLESPRYRLGRIGLKVGGHLLYAVRRQALRLFWGLPQKTQRYLKQHIPILSKLVKAT